MYLAKALDSAMISKGIRGKSSHYWLVAKTRPHGKDKGHVVAVRTTHYIDPSSEASVNNGSGFLCRFEEVSKNPTLILSNESRIRDTKNRSLTQVENTVFKKVADISEETANKISKKLMRTLI